MPMFETQNDDGSVDVVTKAGEIISYVPTTPVEMEFLIRQLSDLVDQIPAKLLELNEVRYDAERAYSRRKNTALAAHAKSMSVTAARALAEVEALVELEAWHNAKAAWHYASDTGQAMRTRLYALLNVNKVSHAGFQGYGAGR